jgi:Tfp pilus assembly protein PilX
MSGETRNDLSFRAWRFESAQRKGFALAAALLTLLLISALVTGVFFAVTEETRAGAASAERQLVLSAAESAVELTIADWNTDWSWSIGTSVTRSAAVGAMEAPVAVHVTRLDSTLYWIVGDATAPSRGSGVSRRIGVAVRVLISSDHSITIDRISERSWSELF